MHEHVLYEDLCQDGKIQSDFKSYQHNRLAVGNNLLHSANFHSEGK